MNIVADFLMPALAFGTLLTVTIVAYFASVRTYDRYRDPNTPKSTLAVDADSHGKPIDT
jgi:hypothetical protein